MKEGLLIGYGAMAQIVLAQTQDDVKIKYILVRPERVVDVQLAVPSGILVIGCLTECTSIPDFAIECAGHSAISQYGPDILSEGIDFGVISVGALADENLYITLKSKALQGHAQLNIIPGAVAGIDALSAARNRSLKKVVYSSHKPPSSWKGTPAESILKTSSTDEEVMFYEGNAREAAQKFPANANVAATIALAGIGFDQTQVRLYSDPAAIGNTHRIHADGQFGNFDIELFGNPLPNNLKTSTLAALSVIRYIRNRYGWISI